MNAVPPLTDEAMQLFNVLTDAPQTIPPLCKRLRMKRPALAQVVRTNYAGLMARGVRFHRAAVSEVAWSIKLASLSNANEPVYISKLSRST